MGMGKKIYIYIFKKYHSSKSYLFFFFRTIDYISRKKLVLSVSGVKIYSLIVCWWQIKIVTVIYIAYFMLGLINLKFQSTCIINSNTKIIPLEIITKGFMGNNVLKTKISIYILEYSWNYNFWVKIKVLKKINDTSKQVLVFFHVFG